MRKIKFRGQTIDTKELIYGDLIQTENDFKNVVEILDWSRVGRKPEKSLVVNPETVGQFTGLFDKNGVEIYEGDIIKCYQADENLVFWYEEDGSWCISNYHASALPLGNYFHDSEVIGNMHENPELLH